MHVQITVHNVFRTRLRFEIQIPVAARCNNRRQRSPVIDKNYHQTLLRLLYVFFWVIPRRLNFICRRFGTLCSIFTHLPMKMEQTECSKTSAYTIQTPGNYPEENIQHTEHAESLKSILRRLLLNNRLLPKSYMFRSYRIIMIF